MAAAVAVQPANTAPPAPAAADALTLPAAQWKLAFADEFDGETLDKAKWSIGLPWGGTDGTGRHHNEQYASYIMDDDIRVAGGSLLLTTQRRDVQGKNGQTFRYTQGMITTRDKFHQTYGYFEARIKMDVDAGPGLWPAFWTLSDGWPPEFDILEIWTSKSHIHQGSYLRNEQGRGQWESFHTYKPLQTGWVTYGMEWGPGYQLYNIDGEVTKRIHGPIVTDQWQYILLNSGVETGSPPNEHTRFPNTFAVDWVRVYDRPDVLPLINGDFEASDRWPWGGYGRANVVRYGASQGEQAGRVDGPNSAIEQRVFGLKPKTRYRVTAMTRKLADASHVRLGVKDFGGEEIASPAANTQWAKQAVEFTTGEDAKFVTVYFYAPEDKDSGMIDAVSIEPVEASAAR
jgi:beta-glucanase (GH16 family)